MAQRIAVAVDFSDCSRRAFDAARALARDLGASMTMIHAAMPAPRRAMRQGSDDPICALEKEIAIQETVELTSDWASAARKDDIEVESICRNAILSMPSSRRPRNRMPR